MVYNASSPDELALLNWARFCGCVFRGVDENNCAIVEFMGKSFKFEILQVLEFNSARLIIFYKFISLFLNRKRQSVIVRSESNQIILYTKGADSVIEKRLKIKE